MLDFIAKCVGRKRVCLIDHDGEGRFGGQKGLALSICVKGGGFSLRTK